MKQTMIVMGEFWHNEARFPFGSGFAC